MVEISYISISYVSGHVVCI